MENALRALRRAVWSQGRNGRAWVDGRDSDGMYIVRIESAEGETYALKVPELSVLDGLIGPPQQSFRDVAVPFKARTAPMLRRVPHDGSEGARVIRVGEDAQDLEGIDVVRLPGIAAAIFTSRGPTAEAQGISYKPYNEDGVILRVRPANADKPALIAIGVFDQAGGEGRVEGSHGAGSAAAAHAVESAIERIEAGADPHETLREATLAAHTAVRALGVGAISTLAVAVVVAPTGGEPVVHVATVGDSRVFVVDTAGEIRHKTKLHNLGASVAAGEVPGAPPAVALRFAAALSRGLGGDQAHPDVDTWPLKPGDRVVVETDGLGDACEMEEMPTGLWHADRCIAEQARIIAGITDVADVVATLIAYALDQAADGYAKPDNTTAGVVAIG
jgi:serine/threonine protein phosphatase PrpC